MNKFVLDFYIKSGNGDKIKSLSDEEFLKLFERSSESKKVALAHLREDYSLLEESLDSFSFLDGDGPINNKLSVRDNVLFLLEVMDYYRKQENSDGIRKRKDLEKAFFTSKYSNFIMSDYKSFLIKNSSFLVKKISNDDYFRSLFFRNISLSGLDYSISVQALLEDKVWAGYLAKQNEVLEYLDSQNHLVLSDTVNMAFFENLPPRYKHLIAYHVRPSFMASDHLKRECQKNIRSVLTNYFSFLSSNEIEELVSLYDSDVTSDEMSSLMSLILKDHSYYSKYSFLRENYFDGNDKVTIAFGRRYFETPLFDSLCESVVPGVKDKLLFLSSVNRLDGISSLDDVMDKDLEELKHIKNDYSIQNDVTLNDVRARGNYGGILFKYDREVAVIDSLGDVSEFDVSESGHLDVLLKIFGDEYSYSKKTIMDITKNAALDGNIVIVIENDDLVVICPFELNAEQKNALISFISSSRMPASISMGYVTSDGVLRGLNNNLSMDLKQAILEIDRMKTCDVNSVSRENY